MVIFIKSREPTMNLVLTSNLQVIAFLEELVQVWVWTFKMTMSIWSSIMKCQHKFKFLEANSKFASKKSLFWTKIPKFCSPKQKLMNKNKHNQTILNLKQNYNFSKCKKLSSKNFLKIGKNIHWMKNYKNWI